MKRFLSLILFAAAFLALQADIPAGYYQRLDGKQKDALKTATFQTIRPHTVVTYNSLFPQQFPQTDVYPELYNGERRWWEMYSNMVFLVRNGWNGMNREHSFPKSWWGGAQNEAYTDLNHLYPSESAANLAKNNFPLGEVMTPTFQNGVTTVGYAYSGQGGGASQVFEPADEYKGDFARTYFYMATCYQDYSWKYTYMVQNGDYPTLRPWAYEMLLDWSRRDPVSQKEVMRNEAVYQIQGNRNPFIDFPELAEYIWGSRTGEVFYVKDQGGAITPPITGEPELFAPQSGTALDFGQVAEGGEQQVELLINGINLSSALSVRVTGTDRKMFQTTITSIPAYQVNSDEGFRLPIKYVPSSQGDHSAAITLYDGGFPDGKSVFVTLHGQALPVPQLSAITPLPAENLTNNSYTARWEAPAEVVDWYIVNRTRFLPDGAVTTRLNAEDNFLEIDDRDPGIEECYSVQSVRLGYESPLGSAMTVAATNSVCALHTAPVEAYALPGAIRLRAYTPVEHFDIYTAAGLKILSATLTTGDNILPLPAGIYLLPTTPTKKIVITP